MPEIHREIAAIEPPLRATIRSLLTGEKPWPFLLWGTVGTGKTSAALCMLDFVGGQYWTPTSLAEHVNAVRNGQISWAPYGEDDPTRATLNLEKFWLLVSKSPLVVIDELGLRGQVSEHVYDCVKRAIDCRGTKPFMGVSNLAIRELERLYDDRVASRLAAGTVIELAGPDRRVQSRKAGKL